MNDIALKKNYLTSIYSIAERGMTEFNMPLTNEGKFDIGENDVDEYFDEYINSAEDTGAIITKKYANDPFYNPGGVYDDFEPLLNQILYISKIID